MLQIDLVYDRECPNVREARANLMRAFSIGGLSARWSEHQIDSPEAPERVQGFGSPTILIDGADVAGLQPGAQHCCRVYEGGGAPSVDLIVGGLEDANHRRLTPAESPAASSSGRWSSTAAVLPGIGVALLPKVVCPLCWPAYAGVLSATGLTFLMEDRWLLPISALFILAALTALGWRAQSRRGFRPLVIGVASSAAILAGKFVFDSSIAVYAGIASLILACVWNAWPRPNVEASCAKCRPITSP